MSNLNKLSRNLRDPVVSTMTGLFSHGPAPLANTLEILGSWALTRCHGTCSKMLQCSSGESRHSSSTPPTARACRLTTQPGHCWRSVSRSQRDSPGASMS
jgi:hypothetical protein